MVSPGVGGAYGCLIVVNMSFLDGNRKQSLPQSMHNIGGLFPYSRAVGFVAQLVKDEKEIHEICTDAKMCGRSIGVRQRGEQSEIAAVESLLGSFIENVVALYPGSAGWHNFV